MSLEFSFGATGWGCIFYLGIVKVLLEKIKNIENIKIATSSSGNIAALILLLKIDSEFAFNLYNKLVQKYDNNYFGNMNNILKEVFDHFVPENVDLNIFNHKLFIYYTTFENYSIQYHNKSYFNSREELLNCILASSYIPYYSGDQIYIDNIAVYDGFFYEQIPCFSENTICFCPSPLKILNKGKDTLCCLLDFNILFPINDISYNNLLLEQGYICGLFTINNNNLI